MQHTRVKFGKHHGLFYVTVDDSKHYFRFADREAVFLAPRSACRHNEGNYYDIDEGSLVRISCKKSIEPRDDEAIAIARQVSEDTNSDAPHIA